MNWGIVHLPGYKQLANLPPQPHLPIKVIRDKRWKAACVYLGEETFHDVMLLDAMPWSWCPVAVFSIKAFHNP